MTSIKRVAQLAGVSTATVSRVINTSGYVRPELRARVQDAMQRLHYQPNALARSMRTQHTLTVGVLVPQIDHPFFGALAFAVERALFTRGYRTFLCSAEENAEQEDGYIDMLLRQRVDGLILVPTGRSDTSVARLAAQGVPFVTVDRAMPCEYAASSAVLSDNRGGARDVALHLLDLGHERVGVIGAPTHSEPIVHRFLGLRDAFASRAVPFPEDLVWSDEGEQFELGYAGARALLGRAKAPSAIVALTDVVAVGVLHAAHDLGLRVPGDLSVTGFDDIPLARHVLPGLTTVAQPIYEMGRRAAELLLGHVQATTAPAAASPARLEFLPTHLVVRASTAAPATRAKGPR